MITINKGLPTRVRPILRAKKRSSICFPKIKTLVIFSLFVNILINEDKKRAGDCPEIKGVYRYGHLV